MNGAGNPDAQFEVSPKASRLKDSTSIEAIFFGVRLRDRAMICDFRKPGR
jgi:hypothetical protein